MIFYDEKIRVRYKDTDQMGIVHHSNYIVYYEVARVAALRAWGMPYDEMERNGIISPILEVGSKYLLPAHFDEVITVRVIVEEMPMVRLKVRYELYNEAGTLINTGHTWLGFLNAETRRPCRVPEYVVEKMRKLMNESEKIYKIGDFYDDGKKQGVVFEVSNDGKHGKIVSLTEVSKPWTHDSVLGKSVMGVNDKCDGANNISKIKQLDNWQEKFESFAFCADLGEGWYLPAIEELKVLLLNKDVYDAVHKTLSNKGVGLNDSGFYNYISSTESEYTPWQSWDKHVDIVNMKENAVATGGKHIVGQIRAVSVF